MQLWRKPEEQLKAMEEVHDLLSQVCSILFYGAISLIGGLKHDLDFGVITKRTHIFN